MSVNYGFESVRILSPVPTGKRVRGHFTLKECTERKAGQWRLLLHSTVEVEREEKPALAADWLVAVLGES